MFCTFALALCMTPPPLQHVRPDPIVDIARDKPEMAAAIRTARDGLPDFFKRYAAPGRGESYFLIKYDLVPGKVDEFIWARVVARGDGVTAATLVNNPRAPGYRRGQSVTIPDAAVIDWSYVRDGKRVEGAFTTRALLTMVSPSEAAALRKSHGWD